MSEKIRLLVVSPRWQTRDGLTKLLNIEDDFEVVAAAENGLEGLQKAGELQPDVVLTGTGMPDVPGLEFIRRLKDQLPLVGIVVVSLADNPQYIQRAYRAGADAYVVKPIEQDEVEAAVRHTYAQIKARSGAEPARAEAGPAAEAAATPSRKLFVSYSRSDWDEYVEPLVTHVRTAGFDVWVDQHLLHGGDYWFDEINEALESSDYLILCVSPEALASKFVKMEYRYFFLRDKPIVPIMCRTVDRLPAELQIIQYQPYDLDALVALLRALHEEST